MKKIVLPLVLLLATPVTSFATVTSSMTIANDFVFRGLHEYAFADGQRRGVAVVQGSITYNHDSGVGVGLWTSNTGYDVGRTSFGGYQVNPYVFYAKNMGSWDWNVGVSQYMWPLRSEVNSTDITATVGTMGFKLFLSYVPDYLGAKSDQWYENLSYVYMVDNEVGVNAAVGYTTFGDEKKVFLQNYLDWKIGVTHTKDNWTVELAYTDSNTKEYDPTIDKFVELKETEAFLASLTRNF